MSKLFNFISWILLIGGLAGILLIGTDHLSENFTSLVAAASFWQIGRRFFSSGVKTPVSPYASCTFLS